jgi:hypothetical protein
MKYLLDFFRSFQLNLLPGNTIIFKDTAILPGYLNCTFRTKPIGCNVGLSIFRFGVNLHVLDLEKYYCSIFWYAKKCY